MQAQTKGAAFFDMDRTLIEANSGRLYIKNERKEGRLSSGQMMMSALYLLMYHFSLVDLEAAFHKGAKHFRGQPEARIKEQTRAWFESHIQNLLLPGARRALDDHRDQEHACILLTGSSSFIAELAVEAWQLDDWLANCFPTDDKGMLTGELRSPICYGDGKVYWAEKWAAENDISLEESFFYTDSYSDLSMLERVGFPRIVNPDPRLRRIAKQRDWPILDWR